RRRRPAGRGASGPHAADRRHGSRDAGRADLGPRGETGPGSRRAGPTPRAPLTAAPAPPPAVGSRGIVALGGGRRDAVAARGWRAPTPAGMMSRRPRIDRTALRPVGRERRRPPLRVARPRALWCEACRVVEQGGGAPLRAFYGFGKITERTASAVNMHRALW